MQSTPSGAVFRAATGCAFSTIAAVAFWMRRWMGWCAKAWRARPQFAGTGWRLTGATRTLSLRTGLPISVADLLSIAVLSRSKNAEIDRTPGVPAGSGPDAYSGSDGNAWMPAQKARP